MAGQTLSSSPEPAQEHVQIQGPLKLTEFINNINLFSVWKITAVLEE